MIFAGAFRSTAGNIHTKAYILDICVLQTLWQLFWESPFLFQLDNALTDKTFCLGFGWFCGEKLDWPAQIADLNTIQHMGDEF